MARLQDALGLMQDAEVATEQLLTITAEYGSDLPPLTIFAMGSVAQRYRDEAADLLASMSRRLKVLDGSEWVALEEFMAARHQEALTAVPAPRPRTLPIPSVPAAGAGPASAPTPVVASTGTEETDDPPGTPDRVAVIGLAVVAGDPETAPTAEQAEPPGPDEQPDDRSPGSVGLVAYQEPPAGAHRRRPRGNPRPDGQRRRGLT